jgi:hypothetical protein
MKKIYNQPACIVVELRGRDALMSVSAETSLGMGYRGTTSEYTINDADVKSTSDVNLWNNEW